MRNLIVGLDGFEISVARGMATLGKLPFFEKLFTESATFHLEHGEARDTGLAWEHFATGKSPEDYQRWSAVTFDQNTYEVRQSPSVERPFTADLGAHTVVFDAPYHRLSASGDAPVGLVDWGAHDPGVPAHANPSSLIEEVRGLFGEYPAKEFIYGFVWPSVERTKKMAAALVCAAKTRTAIAEWLLLKRFADWETAIIVTSELHSASEAMWHGWQADHPLHSCASADPARQGMEDLYIETDRMLARLYAAFPDARLVAFAMHGMGNNHADVLSMALLPEFLLRLDAGQRALSSLPEWREFRGTSMDEKKDWSNAVKSCMDLPKHASQSSSIKWMDRLLFRSGSLKKRANRAVRDSLALDWMPSALYAPLWPDMRAFALPSFYDGQVRLNLAGREARGKIELQDYEAELKRLEVALHGLRDPYSNEPVVRSLSFPVADKPLDASETECDIKISWASGSIAMTHQDTGLIGPLPYRRTGGHTGETGFAALLNCGLRPGFGGVRSSMDVSPTVANLAGVAATGGRFSGQSLLDG
jgi:predicted AlkP superfamily phosphohydrolase/phosphomutase